MTVICIWRWGCCRGYTSSRGCRGYTSSCLLESLGSCLFSAFVCAWNSCCCIFILKKVNFGHLPLMVKKTWQYSDLMVIFKKCVAFKHLHVSPHFEPPHLSRTYHHFCCHKYVIDIKWLKWWLYLLVANKSNTVQHNLAYMWSPYLIFASLYSNALWNLFVYP